MRILQGLSNLFACKHKRLTPVQEDGKQYCIYCNMAFDVPCTHKWELFGKDKQKCSQCGELRFLDRGPCRHNWENVAQTDISHAMGHIIGYLFIQKCSQCGEMKSFRTGVATPYGDK